MKFKAVDPDENFALARFVSSGGRWEVGLRPMMFGVRVSIGAVGAVGSCVDYCAGPVFGDQVTILAAVLTILENVSEERTEGEMRRFFPYQTTKPLGRDPECWAEILVLAGEEFARGHTLSPS